MATQPMATSLPAANPGTAGNVRTGPGAGSRTPERDAATAGKRKPNPNAKGVNRRVSSRGGARSQALANIATMRRIGRMGGSAKPMPGPTAKLGKNLPASNMSDNDADD